MPQGVKKQFMENSASTPSNELSLHRQRTQKYNVTKEKKKKKRKQFNDTIDLFKGTHINR